MDKKIVMMVILILMVLPTLIPLFNLKFFYTQDYIFVARLNQMSTDLAAGYFPPRWSPDLRFGEPTFNYYAPLPYYLGALIHLIGFRFIFGDKYSFIWIAKTLFMLSSILSAITMYIFAQKLFGKKAGFLAATVYTYAPYRAVDTYVRGALSESWSFVFFPLIFYTSYLLSQKSSLINFGYLSLSLAGFFLTHNVTTLMFMPFILFWWVYLIIQEKKIKIALGMLSALLLGLGLAAFFLLPASFERNFIQTKYLLVGYFNFRAHFVAFSQLFSTFWGYGSSLWGPYDGLSFQVGLVNWIIVLLSLVFGFLHRQQKKFFGIIIFFEFSLMLSIFLQHNKSAFIWESIPLMAFIQFPWRFLGITVFIISLISAAITPYFKGKLTGVYFLIITGLILSTVPYFRPNEFVDNTFFEKFLDKDKMQQGIDLPKDYLPLWVKTTDGPFFSEPKADSGVIQVPFFLRQANRAFGQINVQTDANIVVPLTYFPGWTVFANGQKINLDQPLPQGLIRFKLPKGQFKIELKLDDTPVRTLGNSISLVSLLFLILMFTFRRIYHHE